MRTLTLFSRPECHLCDAFMAELAPLLGDRARVEIVDVDSSIALERRYGLRIPVLVDGDVEICAYPFDRAAVEKYLG